MSKKFRTIIIVLLSTFSLLTSCTASKKEISSKLQCEKINPVVDTVEIPEKPETPEVSKENETQEIKEEKEVKETEVLNKYEIELQRIKDDDASLDENLKNLFYSNEDIQTRINNYLQEDTANVSYLYYDFKTNECISLNENKSFYAASTYKLNLNILVYDQIQKGNLSQNDAWTLEYYADEASNEYMNYYMYQMPTNIISILDDSVLHSDNTAASLIYHKLAGSWTGYREMYFDFFNIQDRYYTNDTTCTNELAVLKHLYYNQENYPHLIYDLENTDFHDRLDRYIPTEIVAHKIGTYDYTLNDTGIVFSDSPYAIICLTDSCFANQYEIIGNISKAFYLYNLNSLK